MKVYELNFERERIQSCVRETKSREYIFCCCCFLVRSLALVGEVVEDIPELFPAGLRDEDGVAEVALHLRDGHVATLKNGGLQLNLLYKCTNFRLSFFPPYDVFRSYRLWPRVGLPNSFQGKQNRSGVKKQLIEVGFLQSSGSRKVSI